MMIPIIFGAIAGLLTIVVFIYFVNTPLNIKVPFIETEKRNTVKPYKFQNNAPVAPDMLFGAEPEPLPTYEQIPPRSQFTPAPERRELTPLQADVAEVLWYLRRMTCVARDEYDMVVISNKTSKGREVGLIRCMGKERIHIGHVKDVIKLADELGLKAKYIVGFGRMDKPAFKLAVRKDVKFINEDKLAYLRERANTPKFNL